MAKQQLNRTEVGTAFEQIDRKRVTQGMRRDRPGDARSLPCLLANPFNGVPRDRLPGPITWKQPLSRMGLLPILPQNVQQSGREYHVAVLAPLALIAIYVLIPAE